jgi:acetyl-CoA carboxylase biotin carboxyl carrier protein
LERHGPLGAAPSVQEIHTMQLPLDQLKSLLETLEEGGVSEFEYEDDKVRVKVAFPRGQAAVVSSVVAAAPAGAGAAAPAAPAIVAADPNVVFVTSPFVGTFYKAPSPEAESFVSVNGSVKKGQTLCIIEAMKLMNEIEAEFAGTVLEVLVDSGKSVEFGQKLFKIRKS